MSVRSIKYLQELKNSSDKTLYYNSFVISLIGIVGLAYINESNNKVNLKLKQYRTILNNISSKNLDIYVLTQSLYDDKMITMSYAMRIISLLQMFRNNSKNSIDDIVNELILILDDLSDVIKNKLSIDIKIVLNTVTVDNIDDIVGKLWNYVNRKNMILDFVDIGKNMRVRK